VFPALALGVGEGDEHIMDRAPRPSDEPILKTNHWLEIGAYGLFIAACVLGVFGLARTWLSLDTTDAVTISFLTLALGQLWHVFNMRSPSSPLLNNAITRNGYVWGAIVLCLGLLAGALYVPVIADVLQISPPGASGWLLITGGSILPLIAGQVYLSLRT
jgi:Ca2+-transporting ATPase